ncbi:hypothetical protein BWQ96_01783 [Gracilariopsis chorda]|uniref:Uncharacterized protein n=1 Tax=Gracilariopsis chorda TaxID=448386 RepID=A0A2V3J1W8_9FLOR|nr:hypothetical protein BWQ96_01783 [Gracilariopsis chorda]|eukprot:PXF48323.1 hypothetical protein BWQ96_01783 [Gracilariopsis chorda]
MSASPSSPMSFLSLPSTPSSTPPPAPPPQQPPLSTTFANRAALYEQVCSLKSRMQLLRSTSDDKSQYNALLIRVQQLFAQLYPTHPRIRPLLAALATRRDRLLLLRGAFRDQRAAIAKLDDGANLLLLVSEHIALLISCYSTHSSSCTSSSASSSCASLQQTASRLWCMSKPRQDQLACDDEESAHSADNLLLAQQEEQSQVAPPPSPPHVQQRQASDHVRPTLSLVIPRNYKAKYLRKCSLLAADALSSAVDLSSFLAQQLHTRGQHLLVPDIHMLCRPCLSIVDLPGGFTLIFRSELLQRMAEEALRMRRQVFEWRRKQVAFCLKLRKNLAACRKSMQRELMALMDVRMELALQEFGSNTPSLSS